MVAWLVWGWLGRYKIDLAALQKTRWLGEDILGESFSFCRASQCWNDAEGNFLIFKILRVFLKSIKSPNCSKGQ